MGEGKPGEKGEYAEYFMPVNEHKKSLRGEKMYVNKSAEKTGGCRKAWFLQIVKSKIDVKIDEGQNAGKLAVGFLASPCLLGPSLLLSSLAVSFSFSKIFVFFRKCLERLLSLTPTPPS